MSELVGRRHIHVRTGHRWPPTQPTTRFLTLKGRVERARCATPSHLYAATIPFTPFTSENKLLVPTFMLLVLSLLIYVFVTT